MKKWFMFLFGVLLFFGMTGIVNAALWDRGGGLIYDDVLDITWLQDANYASTSGGDIIGGEGLMPYNDAIAWADQLVYGGFDDWRLPTTVDGPWVSGNDGTTTAGYNITTSEMGYMYSENLGIPGNSDLFINLQSFYYRSGTGSAQYPSTSWIFNFQDGYQTLGAFTNDCYAWAVRDGDSTATVPVPSTMLLLVSGLLGLSGVNRKK